MENKHIYTLHLTKRQLELLSYACDNMSRAICGQDNTYQELMERAWEKRCKQAVGGHGMDKEWEGGWWNMRHDAERLSKEIKRRFWGLENNALYGLHYEDTSDILFDIHRVIRHQLWKDNGSKTSYTVDAENPTWSDGTEPLPLIEKKEEQ